MAKSDLQPTMTLTTFSEAAIVAFVFALEDAVLRGKLTAELSHEIRVHANEFYDALLAGDNVVKSDGKVSIKRGEPKTDVVEIDPEEGQ